jgi:hypothetical protein
MRRRPPAAEANPRLEGVVFAVSPMPWPAILVGGFVLGWLMAKAAGGKNG